LEISLTAFVSFVQAYAIWIYLLLLFGILLGIKVLMDARRLSRTTLFSLDQERAVEQSFRSIVLIIVFFLAMVVVTGINLLVAPVAPTPEPPILRGPTPTLAAIIFPANTPVPTLSPTMPALTETPFFTATPVAATATRVIKPTAPPVLPATPTPPLPAPVLTYPPNNNVFTGEGQATAAITFKWTWICDQCTLGPNDGFVIGLTYEDKFSGKPVTFSTGQMRETSVRMADIIRGGVELYQKAKEDKFQWYVQVKRGDQPLTPQSEIWKFTWH
jgi:hypothetical protein